MSNAPDFDPLNCTPEQEVDLVKGYRDGLMGREPPAVTSIAYDTGRRNGTNDRAGIADPEQRLVARRLVGVIGHVDHGKVSLAATVARAMEAARAMPLSVVAANLDAQRRSWEIGETLLANPKMSRAEAEALVDRVLAEEKRA
jgi:hypothetical protein